MKKDLIKKNYNKKLKLLNHYNKKYYDESYILMSRLNYRIKQQGKHNH